MEILATLPETPERARRELLLQVTLGQASIVTRGFGAPEAEQAFVRARDLCEQVDDPDRLFRALRGLFLTHQPRAEHEKAGALAEELLHLARETRDPAQLLMAHLSIGESLSYRARLRRAREHLERAIELYDPQEYEAHEYLSSPLDPGVAGFCYLSWTLWQLGYPDQGSTRGREALALARELSHPYSQAYALYWAGRLQRWCGEARVASESTEAMIALSNEHGFPQLVAVAAFFSAAALADQGKLEEGTAGMHAALEALRATGLVVEVPQMLTELGEAHAKAGQPEEGLAVVAEAQELVTKSGEREYEAELHRVRGELLLARSPSNPGEAEAAFRDALDVARRQSAKSWELRAATSLARLWQQQGRKQEARELLAPVCDWFTEGFDTKDLRDAKSLLDGLS